MGTPASERRPPLATGTVYALMVVLLVAAGLRLYRLPTLPVGLHYDEAANGILAGEIAAGLKHPVFIPSYTGKEVLFFYWAALWMRLLGSTPFALRLSAALLGLLTVAATVWAAGELLGGPSPDTAPVALTTGAFLATSFWHLLLSRYGFRAVAQPLLQALTVAALWRGLRHSSRRWLVVAGLFCGLTAYTYLAARAFPIPLAAALLVGEERFRAGRGRQRIAAVALFLLVAALTISPLAHYWLTHPGSFLARARQVAAGDWEAAWRGVRACLGMFFLEGDPYIRFNLPGRPLLDPLTALLALVGLFHLLTGPLPAPTRAFLLAYLPTMLLPSAPATGEITPSNLRAVGLLPFLYLLPALGLRRLLGRRARLTGVVGLLYALSLALPTADAYFRRWATSADLYYAADGDLAAVAAYLNANDLTDVTPYVASVHYRHPTVAFLARDYRKVRWLTGGATVVFPAAGEGLLIYPRSADGDLDWVRSLLPEGSRVPVAAPDGPDGAPAFRAYRVRPGDLPSPPRPLDADFAHIARVTGYAVVGEPRSGGETQVAVWLRILNPPDQGDYGPVARLTDPWGFVWGEAEPFHYPSVQWTPGEVVVEHLRLPVAPGTPPGEYAVRFGLYSAASDRSLPLLDETGRYAGLRVPLPVTLGRAVAPPAVADLHIRRHLDTPFDGLTLLGYNLDTPALRPGEHLYLTLFWRAERDSPPASTVRLALGDEVIYAAAPVHGTYPFPLWEEGEIVADRYDPRIPRTMPPGYYPLRLTVGERREVLNTVTVRPLTRTFDLPAVSHPVSVTLGGKVSLVGYDLSAEEVALGGTLAVVLYWRPLATLDEDYTVFVHLVAPDGSLCGQDDRPPVDGTYPTGLWLPGEVVADRHTVAVCADGGPGEYVLETGMYLVENGARLAVDGSPDDAVRLQTVSVLGALGQNSPISPTRNRSISRNPSRQTAINSVDIANAWP